jgi:hypothetical protein
MIPEAIPPVTQEREKSSGTGSNDRLNLETRLLDVASDGV